MDKSYQLFVPHFEVDECLEEIRECLEKGWTGIGFKTAQIEEAWVDYTAHDHAHFLNSNTSGLHLAVKIYKDRLGWNDGDEIITTPLTFVSTNHAVMYENMKPVFADVDESLCLSLESIKQRVTPMTRAVIYVGFGGNTGSLDEVASFCRENNLILILDAAHMAGTRYHGVHVGLEADCAVYSFQAVKNLPTADSGMICFKEKEDDDQARKLSWLGINKDTYARFSDESTAKGNYKWLYGVDDVGFKYHGNSIMASLALVGLKYLDRDNARRRTISSWYSELLGDRDDIAFVPMNPECEPSRHLFQIRVGSDKRDGLMTWLNDNGVFPGVHYRINTDYSVYSYGKGTCPYAEQASLEIISLPLHMSLEREDIEEICRIVKEGLDQ